MKDWLATELDRNKSNAALFVRLLRRAFADKKELEVIIAHHLTIEYEGRLETVDEIPSADTMMFDHDIMGAVFGERARAIMATLARLPVKYGLRDMALGEYLESVDGHRTVGHGDVKADRDDSDGGARP